VGAMLASGAWLAWFGAETAPRRLAAPGRTGD
jgi:hypothetical protein